MNLLLITAKVVKKWLIWLSKKQFIRVCDTTCNIKNDLNGENLIDFEVKSIWQVLELNHQNE